MKKLLILFPIFFMFLLTLGGCSPSGIVIRSVHDVPTDVQNTMNDCPNVTCLLSIVEKLPTITGNTVSTSVCSFFGTLRGEFYASFNTGRAPVGAITWTLTVNDKPVAYHNDLNIFFVYDLTGTVVVDFGNSFPTQAVRLIAHADGVPSRSIILTAPGGVNALSPSR